MQIRERTRADLGHLADVAREVHRVDGYPRYNPDDDLAGFLDPAESIGAWVALVEGVIIGHVSLHSASSPEVIAVAMEGLEVEAGRFGVVARLLVDPSHRGVGAGRALLETAEREARDRQLVPILDVIDRFEPAIALYERLGWRRLGSVRIAMSDQSTIRELVYAAPVREQTGSPPSGERDAVEQQE